MSSAQPQPASATTDVGAGPFVINLCSSTTPMALARPQAPELKRFTFFMSRRLEDGRERFRLHMGYFTALPEAEEWLAAIRDIYPGAWVGEAPGKRLREKAKRAPAPVSPAPAQPGPAQPALPMPPAAVVPTLQPVSTPVRQSPFEESNVREVLAALDTPPPSGKAASPGAAAERAAADRAIALLEPEDTGTRRALSDAERRNAPGSFAVQLQWSVQPIDLVKVPPLAIFGAYTLYTVDGSREGRRWYGLRLGFFSDPVSAKQVAQYVRSEFSSVAVVPVTAQEQERATGSRTRPVKPLAPAPEKPPVEVPLLDDSPPENSKKTAASDAPRARRPSPRAQVASLNDKQRRSQGKAQRAKAYRAPQTLEETLEILGAGDLEIDNGRGELLDRAAVRHLSASVQKNSPFSRLLDRIAEKVQGDRRKTAQSR